VSHAFPCPTIDTNAFLVASKLVFLTNIDTLCLFVSMLQVAQPTITDYERSRERRVAANLKKMQELRLHTLRADLNNSLPQPESSKGKKSANKKTNSSDSDSSEYLLDDDDQGDSDDDDTETDEQPPPLAIKVLLQPSM
jgi:hypothetical protein